MSHIAFVTDSAHPDGTTDDRLAVPFLKHYDQNIEVTSPVWTDASVNWRQFDLVIVRTTWDYSAQYDAFGQWLNRLEQDGVRLYNPAPIMRWNADKVYLRTMADQGVSILPTAWYARGEQVSLAAELSRYGWSDVVIKPTVSGGSRRTWHITQPLTVLDQTHLDEILHDSAAMIQPFATSIVTEGEWSFVFFNRRFSHALLKQAQPGDFRVQQQFGGATIAVAEPPPTLQAQAAQVLDAVDGPLLYARVDGVNVAGRFQLMELELIEPRLFLDTAADAPRRFAEAMQALL